MTYTLQQLADLTGSTLIGSPTYEVSGVEDLEFAGPEHVSFLDNPRYEQKMRASSAGVVVIHKSITPLEGRCFLISDAPSLTFQKLIELFIPEIHSGFGGIHPTATIHPSATIGEDVEIGPYVVVDQGCHVGHRTRLHAHVALGPEVSIGDDCNIYSHVSIRERCVLGHRVVIQPGAVIGSSGFGYHTSKQGKHTYLKQLGNVVLEDDVEIGANTTIDRARFKSTLIKRGSKIDNLVQIAHQVEIGEDNLVVSQTGIAGSSKTGKHVILGGQVGIVGHIEIGDQVIMAARSAATKSIDKPGIYSGAPAIPIKDFNELMVIFRNLPKLAGRLKDLEKLAGDYLSKLE